MPHTPLVHGAQAIAKSSMTFVDIGAPRSGEKVQGAQTRNVTLTYGALENVLHRVAWSHGARAHVTSSMAF